MEEKSKDISFHHMIKENTSISILLHESKHTYISFYELKLYQFLWHKQKEHKHINLHTWTKRMQIYKFHYMNQDASMAILLHEQNNYRHISFYYMNKKNANINFYYMNKKKAGLHHFCVTCIIRRTYRNQFSSICLSVSNFCQSASAGDICYLEHFYPMNKM